MSGREAAEYQPQEKTLQEAHRRLALQANQLQTQSRQLEAQAQALAESAEALRLSEQRYRTLAEFTWDWEFWLRPDGRFEYNSPSVQRTVGRPVEPDIGAEDLLRRIVHPEDLTRCLDHLRAELAGTDPFEMEFRILRPEGEVRWLHHRCQPIHDAQGRFLGTRGSNRDITERKQSEEQLRQANEQLQAQAEALQAQREELLTQAEELQSQTDELQAQTAELKASNEELRRSREALRRAHEDLRMQSEELKAANEKLRAQTEQLQASEQRLALALSGTRVGLYDRNLATGEVLGTEQLAWLMGLRPTTTATTVTTTTPTLSRVYHYRDWAERVYPDDWKRTEAELQRCMAEHRPFEADYRVLLPEGGVRWIADRGVFQYDAEGRPTSLIGILIDATEHKRAEETLREWNAALESQVAQRTAELRRRASQLQKMTLEVSQAEDRERKRMAEILHDDVQQIIAGAKFHVGLLASRVKGDASLQTLAAQIDQMLKEAIEKSRGLSHELSPAVLNQGDFAETLRWLARQVQTKHGLVVHVDANGCRALESDAIRSFLYKAAQELLFNVVKHARVKEARVRFRRHGPYACLTVSDRGSGFDLQKLHETAGFGLLSIRERIELLGGRMKIRSRPDHGSTFFVVVPEAQGEAVLEEPPRPSHAMILTSRVAHGAGRARGEMAGAGVPLGGGKDRPTADTH